MRFAVGVASAVLIVLLVAFLIAFLSGCFRSAPPSESAEPEPVETAAPTPTPEPSPTPEATWEEARLIEIERYVRAYGNCPDEAAVQARMATMAIDPERKMIAFTFDDGPRTGITEQILDIVEENGIRVTFFIKGANIAGHEEQLMRMLSLGCEIGNHTWNHTDIETLSAADMRTEIGSVNDAIRDRFGYSIKLFRPPYIRYGDPGDETRTALVSLMQEWDMAVINHTRSTHDTHNNYTADMIYSRGVEEFDELGKGLPRAIILCHDKQQKTVDAFRRIVPELLSRGYQFVTVSELLHYSSGGFRAGAIYSSGK